MRYSTWKMGERHPRSIPFPIRRIWEEYLAPPPQSTTVNRYILWENSILTAGNNSRYPKYGVNAYFPFWSDWEVASLSTCIAGECATFIAANDLDSERIWFSVYVPVLTYWIFLRCFFGCRTLCIPWSLVAKVGAALYVCMPLDLSTFAKMAPSSTGSETMCI